MLFEIVIKSFLILLYVLVSGYVLTFGKPNSGLRRDYVIFIILILLMLIRM